MDFMDLLFREYASPFVLLDSVISAGHLVDFLNTFARKHEEHIRWEFYLYKLSAWDERTWEEFNHDLDFGTQKQQDRPSDEDIEATIKQSYGIMANFNPEEGG